MELKDRSYGAWAQHNRGSACSFPTVTSVGEVVKFTFEMLLLPL
jgi:hypothetical protein